MVLVMVPEEAEAAEVVEVLFTFAIEVRTPIPDYYK